MSSVPTSQMLGTRQLGIHLKERGIDPASIPQAAVREIVEMAGATLDLNELRSSQAMVTYLGLLNSYSDVVADYCKAPTQAVKASDKAICDILKKHGVK